jgi:MYXO-CTERM domain-containing protein
MRLGIAARAVVGAACLVLATSFVPELIASAYAQLIISEVRLRGPNGANDEYVEIYNNSGADHTVAGGGTGYALAASNGVARFVIPNGTVIPNRGTYLGVNSVGYSLASYPAGNGTTATGDATYTTNIPDNAGIALFNTSVAANFTLANRLDAVGSTSEANTLYKEGTGYPALTPFSINYAFYRDTCGNGGSITTFTACPNPGVPKDTNNNAADFVFVDTNGTSAGAGQRLGAPGPENLSSPVFGVLPAAANVAGTGVSVALLDPCVSANSPPNQVRDFTSDPANNSTFGTLDIRRRITNNTGGNITRLRFRIIDLTTFPAPSGIADLRPRTSTAVVVTVDQPPCGSGTSNITVQGMRLEEPPSQPNGGGFNSSMSAGTVTLATPLAPGASIDVRFLLGLQQTGCARIAFDIPLRVSSNTESPFGSCDPTPTPTATPTITPTPTATPTCILGDINCDRIVDIRDYGLWRQNFGQQGAGNPADLNQDGIVDIRDYGVWRANFGHMAGAAPRGTPGPALLARDQASIGGGSLRQVDGFGHGETVIPLVGGLLGLGGLVSWRRRRPPGTE